MNDLAVSLASLIIGVVASVWVSHYYFKRTTDKSLTPYLQFMSSLFDGVDPSVRESLKIAYKGTAVTELLDVQFLIANTGERPIRDVLAPLTLSIPENCSLLDASILHVAPEGREVEIKHTPQSVEFRFPLLNTGEFFITKLLLQGKAKSKDFKFAITVDDLPPVLSAVRMPPELIERERKREFEWELLVIGSILTLVGVAVAALIYLQWPILSLSWNQGLFSSFRTNWLILVSSVVAAIPALLLLVAGPMLCVGAFTDFSFPKRRRFRVPDALHRRHFFRDLPPPEVLAELQVEANHALQATREDARA
jgi:hypothetical protein